MIDTSALRGPRGPNQFRVYPSTIAPIDHPGLSRRAALKFARICLRAVRELVFMLERIIGERSRLRTFVAIATELAHALRWRELARARRS